MIETKEWCWLDKAAWGAGPWDGEPDKKQWADRETGLACLVLRNDFGALCGYVGVPQSHPAHGLHHDGATAADAERRSAAFRAELRRRARSGKPLLEWVMGPDLLPEAPRVPGIGARIAAIEVHGGLTFAGPSVPLGAAAWAAAKAEVDRLRSQAQFHPRGDAARWLREWAPVLDDYAAWRHQGEARRICHVSGEPDDVWWFGFDCGHAGDASPALDSDLRALGLPTDWATFNEYRSLDYVEREVRRLARQLADLAACAGAGKPA